MKNSDFCHIHVHSGFCLHPNTLIYNCTNHHEGGRKYREDYTRIPKCKTIKQLFDILNSKGRKGGTTKYKVKVFDGEVFVRAKIKNIIKTDTKIQFYKLTTNNGKTIEASLDHRFYTKDGWKKLKELRIGDLLGCNGIPIYEDKEWMQKKYNKENLNQEQIAEICGVSRSVIKNRIKKFGLGKTKEEWMKGHLVKQETTEKIIQAKKENRINLEDPKTESGARIRTQRWFSDLYKLGCQVCKVKNKKIHIHHIDGNPYNNCYDNLMPLCSKHHRQIHAAVPFTVRYETLISIEETTNDFAYDLEVEHDSHNFVANGFIVHNSILDGLASPENLAKRASELGFKYLALTDHASVSGCIKFQKACEKYNISPILGTEFYIVPNLYEKEKGEKRGHILALCKNETGWININKMLTIANLEGFYRRPRIDYKTLLEHSEGLVFSTACVSSFLNQKGGLDFFDRLVFKHSEDVYLECMGFNTQEQKNTNELCLRLKNKHTECKLVATADCLVAGTQIITNFGSKNIEDVNIGDYVFTDKNRFKKVLYCNKRKIKEGERVFKIKCNLGSFVFSATENHPILTYKYKFWDKKNITSSWKEMKDVNENDYLFIPKLNKEDFFIEDNLTFQRTVDLADFINAKVVKSKFFVQNEIEYCNSIRGSIKSKIRIPRLLPLNEDFLTIIGFYIANGNESKNRLNFSFNKKNMWQFDLTYNFFNNLGFSIYVSNKLNEISVNFTSVIFSNFFGKLCGSGSSKKTIPFLNKTLSIKEIMKIVEGYVSCDGCCNKKGVQVVCTTSKRIAYDMSIILNIIGIPTIPQFIDSKQIKNVHKNESANTLNWSNQYFINISGSNIEKLSKFIKLKREYPFQSKKKVSHAVEIENGWIVKIIKKEIVDYDGYVYNIEVDEDNTYTAENIIVHNCHYLNKEDVLTHEILLMIQSKKTFSSPDRWSFNRLYDVYMKTADEMIKSFIQQDQLDRKEYLSAIKNTIEIAEKCKDFRITPKPISLPRIKGLDNSDENDYLQNLCIKGLKNKGFETDFTYLNRMDYELEIIFSKKLSLYFLLVVDLINWCKENNILVGPGRGSVGGSLLAFILGITNVDPIKYDLPFSRFINEERIDYPDIDMDFEDTKRDRVIEYLQNTYGKDNVASISTFLVLQSRGAVRDVCRVYDIPLKDADELAKSIPFNSNLSDELGKEDCSEIILNFRKKNPEIIEQILKIEGTVRGVGRNASGIIVSNDNLTTGNRCNLESRDGNICINWEKNDAENQGLMKLDILGLSTLSVLSYVKDLIKINHNKEIIFEDIDLEDKDVIKMLSDGYTTGTFQSGTVPMTLLIKEMGLEKFSHLVDAVALVRPGSKDAGATEKYIRRKHGEDWERKHPIYEEVTEKTYGTLVTQEQIMNVIHKVAGLSYATSDKIRRIIGKKRDASEFQQFKDIFINGCKKQKTFTKDEAEEFWEGLQHAAHYLFCQAHSTEYAMIGMWTAWIKYYYPSEFLAASLTYGSDDHKQELITEARRLGLKIIPPKIGISDALKWKTDEKKLIAPFNEIKGIGEKTLNKLSSKTDGFFTPDDSILKGKVRKILEEIDAFNPNSELPVTACDYFDINICENWKEMYPKLVELYGDKFNDYSVDDLLKGNVKEFNFCRDFTQQTFDWNKIQSCKACDLHKECNHKILPSFGNYNIMLLGEAGFTDEHREKKPFCGKAGNTLWKELKRYDLHREMFCIFNSVFCAPLKSRNPKQNHVDECRHFVEEQIKIINPCIILVLGNWGRYCLTGELYGIMKANATMEWNEKLGTYLVYCMHPSSVARSVENAQKFSEGIEFFSQKLEDLCDI